MRVLVALLLVLAACGDDYPAPQPDAQTAQLPPNRNPPNCPIVYCHPDAGH